MNDLARSVIEECAELIRSICRAEHLGYENYDELVPEDVNNGSIVESDIFQLKQCLEDYEKLLDKTN